MSVGTTGLISMTPAAQTPVLSDLQTDPACTPNTTEESFRTSRWRVLERNRLNSHPPLDLLTDRRLIRFKQGFQLGE